jgi:cell division protein FtsL
LALVRGLPDHSLIDRLVRGRAWIPVLGVLLAGIVAMQVEILKLGTSMGRAMERSSALQTRNESLQASVASLADDQRIERMAAGMGMIIPTPDSLVFLSGNPNGEVGRAIANIHAPDPVSFTNELAARAAAAAALLPPPPPTVASATGTGATTTPAAGASTTAGTTSATPSSSATSSASPPTSSVSSPTGQDGPATGTALNTAATPTSGATSTSNLNGAAALSPSASSQSGVSSGG